MWWIPSYPSQPVRPPVVGDRLSELACRRCEAVGHVVVAELNRHTGAVSQALCKLCGADNTKKAAPKSLVDHV